MNVVHKVRYTKTAPEYSRHTIFVSASKIAHLFAFIASPYGAPCGIDYTGNSE